MDNALVPQKELDVYRTQLLEAEKFSTTLTVKTDEDYGGALSEAKHIKEQLEIITDREEAITKPLNLALKSVRSLFAPLESMGENALAIVKSKMSAFVNDEEAKAAKKIETIEKNYQDGKISGAVADAKIFIATPDKTVVTDAGRATVTKLKKYYVVDKSLIPLQFLVEDMVKIRASFKAGTPVPGIEERLENNITIG